MKNNRSIEVFLDLSDIININYKYHCFQCLVTRPKSKSEQITKTTLIDP